MTVKPALWWKTEGVKSLLPGKVSRGPHHSLPVLREQVQRGWKHSFLNKSHKDMGQWVKVAPGDFFFPSKKNQSEEEPPWRHRRVPFIGVFQGASEWCAR